MTTDSIYRTGTSIGAQRALPTAGEDIETSGTSAALISRHPHLCEAFAIVEGVPVPQPALNKSFVNYDVEGILPDGSCPTPIGNVFWIDATAINQGL